jgi:hypothetical protein
MAEKRIRTIRKRCTVFKGRAELNDGILDKCTRGKTDGDNFVLISSSNVKLKKSIILLRNEI